MVIDAASTGAHSHGSECPPLLRARGDPGRVLRLEQDHFLCYLEDGQRTKGQAAKIRRVSTGKHQLGQESFPGKLLVGCARKGTHLENEASPNLA